MAARPARGQVTAAAAAGAGVGEEEEECSALQEAFTEAFPWALSVAFHLGVLLLLTFFTTFAVPSGKAQLALAGDDIIADPGPHETFLPHPDEDQQTGSPVQTDFKGETEGYGPNSNHFDFSPPGLELAGTAGGGKGEGPIDIGVVYPDGGVGRNNGTGDGTGIGGIGLDPGTGGGRGGLYGIKPGPHPWRTRGALKIVYLIDHSGSMNDTLDYVKAELKRAIGTLRPRHEFQVLMFNEGAPDEFSFNGKTGLVHASPPATQAVDAWIGRQTAFSLGGQTLPHEAFKKAFAIKPDLIYVLTDGLFDGPDVPAFVAGLNKDKKVLINTILFREHNRAGEAQLIKIAQQNGGIYKFIDEKDMTRDYSGDGK